MHTKLFCKDDGIKSPLASSTTVIKYDLDNRALLSTVHISCELESGDKHAIRFQHYLSSQFMTVVSTEKNVH